jgi:hypothetical protein
MKNIVLIVVTLISFNVLSHGSKKHSEIIENKLKKSVGKDEASKDKKNIIKEIDLYYSKRVRSIFVKSCFDCHGSNNNYPWYYKVPGVKQFIDNDIAKAKKHLDFTNGFPFLSHDKPLNDLRAISKSIKMKTMPPAVYSTFHSEQQMTASEIEIVQEWIKKSIHKLEINK